jgi:hypothetical protein
MLFVVLAIEADRRRARDNIVIACPKNPSNVDNITVEHLNASVMTRAISRRALLEPDNRPNVVKKLEFQAAQYAAFRGRRRWTSPRFSSLLFSLCCLAAAVGTAVDAGTERGCLSCYSRGVTARRGRHALWWSALRIEKHRVFDPADLAPKI